MGTWAEGVFDNDAALDFVGLVADEVKRHIVAPDEVEDLESLMAAVSIYKVLVEHCRAFPPQRNEIATLRDSVLETYDAEIDGLEPTADFKENRRKVLEQTFGEFLALLEE